MVVHTRSNDGLICSVIIPLFHCDVPSSRGICVCWYQEKGAAKMKDRQADI